jgi:hypothetical protein
MSDIIVNLIPSSNSIAFNEDLILNASKTYDPDLSDST